MVLFMATIMMVMKIFCLGASRIGSCMNFRTNKYMGDCINYFYLIGYNPFVKKQFWLTIDGITVERCSVLQPSVAGSSHVAIQKQREKFWL